MAHEAQDDGWSMGTACCSEVQLPVAKPAAAAPGLAPPPGAGDPAVPGDAKLLVPTGPPVDLPEALAVAAKAFVDAVGSADALTAKQAEKCFSASKAENVKVFFDAAGVKGKMDLASLERHLDSLLKAGFDAEEIEAELEVMAQGEAVSVELKSRDMKKPLGDVKMFKRSASEEELEKQGKRRNMERP